MSQTGNAAFLPQIQAADPSRSVWVSANAGTGKTRVLIDRILRLLLNGVGPGRILCLTFTKAASAEMANRLTETLGLWAIMDSKALEAALATLLNRKPDDRETVLARQLFAILQDTPEGLKIRTIHSFCESLLGRFPVEAGLAPHFSVIDERTAAELRLLSRDGVLSSEQAAPLLEHLAAVVNEDGFSAIIQELERAHSRLQNLIRHHGGIENFEKAGKRLLGLSDNTTEETLLAETLKFDVAAMTTAMDALMGGGKQDRKKAGLIRDWITISGQRTPDYEDFSRYSRAFVKADGDIYSDKTFISQKTIKACTQIFHIMKDEQSRVVDLETRFKAIRVMANTMTLVHLGTALIDAYRNIKQDRALMDYDDLILKTRHLLMAEGQASWVHFKLDGGIEHILVDEAQDTSPEQWDVISALASSFFYGSGAESSGGIPGQPPLERTIFAVGDEKQSIYSFQGADPKRFDAMRQFFENKVKAARMHWQNVELGLSFRSTQTILQFVDGVFDNDQARAGLNAQNRPVHHQTFRAGQAGRVDLWPMEGHDETAPDDPWDAPLDQISVHDPMAIVCSRIATTIKDWTGNKEMLPSAGRPIEPSDIIILVRKRGRFTEQMVRTLKQHGIPVAGTDRMIVNQHIAVMDLIALARFTILPEDDLNLACVLKGPFCNLDDDDLLEIAPHRTATLWQAVRDHKDYPETAAMLSAFLGQADTSAPYEFFSRVLGQQHGMKAILERLGPEAADPVHEFLTLSQNYEREHPPSMQGFLQWVETGTTEIKRDLEQSQGVVRVMTVHGAKGLQANIVFLPDTCSTPDAKHIPGLRFATKDLDGDEAMFWPAFSANETPLTDTIKQRMRKSGEDEYRRLLYVAMTRARDRLIIAGWRGKKQPDENCWYNLMTRAFENTEQAKAFPLLWDKPGEKTGLRIEDEQTAAPDGSGAPERHFGPSPDLPGWIKRRPPPEPKRPDPLTPTVDDHPPESLISPLAKDNEDAFKRGRLIHQLLQFLPDMAPENREKSAALFLRHPLFELDQEQQNIILGESMNLLDHPDTKHLFAPGGLSEVPVVGEIIPYPGADSVIVSGQIDRLRIENHVITIIDYKTGRHPPKSSAEIPSGYLRQMALYRAVMGQIYPGKSIRSLLLWTVGPMVMKLDDAVLDQHMPHPDA